MSNSKKGGPWDITPLTAAQKQKLAEKLSPAEREVILFQGTERPFCGGLLEHKASGVYVCRLCGLPLFLSEAKFESGTGWPSFYAPFNATHMREIIDDSHGMTRTEIRCVRCDGHLGHVFADGPAPTGQRYCLNSAALEFQTDDQLGKRGAGAA